MSESPFESNQLQPDDLKNVSSQTVIMDMRCADCGGMYKAYNNGMYLCPYCGSTKVDVDSDAVKIAKDYHATYKEVEISKQQIYKEMELEKERMKRGISPPMTDKERKFLAIYLIAFVAVLLLMMVLAIKFLP